MTTSPGFFPLNFPAELHFSLSFFFFFPKQQAHTLSVSSCGYKREAEACSVVCLLDFSGEDKQQLNLNKLINSTYTSDPDSPAMAETCSGWNPTLLYRTVRRGEEPFATIHTASSRKM